MVNDQYELYPYPLNNAYTSSPHGPMHTNPDHM